MTPSSFPLPLDGGCRCGAVRYRVTRDPLFVFACHCTDCRQLTAGAFSLGMPVPRDGFAVLAGEPRRWTKTADSGKPSHQFWCATCHGWTHTVAEHSPDAVIVRASTLDRSDWVRPVGQIFLRSGYHWARLSALHDRSAPRPARDGSTRPRPCRPTPARGSGLRRARPRGHLLPDRRLDDRRAVDRARRSRL